MKRTIKVAPNLRGFAIGKFKDYNGYECSIQESSIADRPCLWLGVNDPNPQIFPGDNTGWHDYPLPKNVTCTTRMHLTQGDVKKLLPLLKLFVETGEITKPRKSK